jgi:hypothetical protein
MNPSTEQSIKDILTSEKWEHDRIKLIQGQVKIPPKGRFKNNGSHYTYNKTTPPTNSQYLFKEAPLGLLTQRDLGGKSRRRRRNRSTKRRNRKSSKRFS